MKIFNLPDLGEGLAEAEIVRWHVNTGDRIKADDPMLAVETAKAIVEVPAPFSGVIKATHGKPGDTVATGALLVEFEADATDSDPATLGTATPPRATTSTPVATTTPSRATTPAPRAAWATSSEPTSAPSASPPAARATDSGTVVGSMPTSDEDYVEASVSDTGVNVKANGNASAPDRVRAVPAARALAKRLSIDIAHIRGTGRGELVTVDDVLQMAGAGRPQASAAAAHTTATAVTGDAEKLRGPRRAMAQSMAIARDNVVGCTLFDDADLHDWHPEQDITSRILRAIAEGCAAEPGLNAWFDGDALTRRILSHIDVAIAVDTPEGLIVPVVRNIGGRPVAELRRDVDKLKRNTQDRTLSPKDLRDFTFMLSNFGMIAGRYATPVVVPPAVAILGCGRLSHDVIATQSGSSSAKTSSQHHLSGSSSAKTSSQHHLSGSSSAKTSSQPHLSGSSSAKTSSQPHPSGSSSAKTSSQHHLSGSSSAKTSSQHHLSGSSSAKTSSQPHPSGSFEAHLRMPLSLTFDHRCVTGGEAARFLAAVIRDLQKGN